MTFKECCGRIDDYREYLVWEERAPSTVSQYIRDVRVFLDRMHDKEASKEYVLKYKEELECRYLPASVNAKLSAINSFLSFCGMEELRVKQLKIQKSAYLAKERELTRDEYLRMVHAARGGGDERLALILETICSTGIRVSELKYITAEAAFEGEAHISLKGKNRVILLPEKLCRKLRKYIKKKGIKEKTKDPAACRSEGSAPVPGSACEQPPEKAAGAQSVLPGAGAAAAQPVHPGTGAAATPRSIFTGKSGRPLDRTTIWRMLKRAARAAGVDEKKVFPHNLRHLFARCFYTLEKDIAKLADILGHSSINTTRIYLISSSAEHRRQLERVRLVC